MNGTAKLVFLVLIACASSGHGGGQAPVDDRRPKQYDAGLLEKADREMRAAHEKWQRHQLENYGYILQRSCYCLPALTQPLTITVRNGHVVAVAPLAGGQPLPAEHGEAALDVEALFGLVRNAIRNQAYALAVQYDPRYGYPAKIKIDLDAMIADEEIEYSARDLEPR